MSGTVCPKLNNLLRAGGLTVAELQRQLEERYALRADTKMLARLSNVDAMHCADLEIAGAVAELLGVGLAELLETIADPDCAAARREDDVLTPEEGRRLSELFDRRSYGKLSQAEERELKALVHENGLRLHELRMRQLAERRGISVEQAHREAAAELDAAIAWWREFEADPRRRAALVAEAKRHRTQGSE